MPRQILLWTSGALVLLSGAMMTYDLGLGDYNRAFSPAVNVISNLIVWITWKWFL
jgi:hypothetical protein